MHSAHHDKKPAVFVFGCGNTLSGDDGFGPAVIADLQSSHSFSDAVVIEDVGTRIKEYLLDFILAPKLAPRQLIILDAVDFAGKKPGEVFTITPDTIPAEKTFDFSLHQFPAVSLLKEIAEHTGATVHLIVAQVESIPDKIAPGLSPSMQDAVKEASKKVRELLAIICPPVSEVSEGPRP